MNNSKISQDSFALENEPELDKTPWLRERQTEIVEIIEALEAVKQSSYWKVLQNKIFTASLELLQRKIRNEKDSKEIFRLQGQLGWAEKFADLDKMVEVYRKELENIKQQLKH